MCAHTMILISFSSESDIAVPSNKFTALRSKIVHLVCHQLLLCAAFVYLVVYFIFCSLAAFCHANFTIKLN